MLPEHLRLTYEDYVLLPDDGKRHEIIEGDHYVTPAPKYKHQKILINLSVLLCNFAREKNLGEILVAPMDVVLSDNDIVQPDILFISSRRRAIITEDNIRGAPDLLIEILSESSLRNDKLIKKKRYEKFGVQEYWIVDPISERVEVFTLEEYKYRKTGEFEENEVFSSPLFPGLEISLNELFR